MKKPLFALLVLAWVLPAIAQLPIPVLPPVRVERTITSPAPNLQGWSPPLLTIKGAQALVLDRTEYVQQAWGQGGATMLVTDMNVVQPRWKVTNCIFRGFPSPPYVNGLNWCCRGYNLTFDIDRSRFAASGREHPIYVGVYGSSTITSTTIANAGSQGIQLSLLVIGKRPEDSPSWPLARTLTIKDVNILECGRQGGTRLGFVFSMFKHGPLFKLHCERLFIQTVKQSRVVQDSSGRWCDSTGGIFVAGCQEAIFTGCVVELKNPEKSLAQFYNYSLTPESSNAPERLILDDCTFNAIGGGPRNVDVRIDETDYIRVLGCDGNAVLRCWAYNQARGKYEIVLQQPITQDFAQG